MIIKDVTNVTFAIRALSHKVSLKDIKEFTPEKDHMSVMFAKRALITHGIL